MKKELPFVRPITPVAMPERSAMITYGAPAISPPGYAAREPLSGVERAVRAPELVGLVAQRARVPDRADLGEVALEGEADGPVDHRAKLPEDPRDLDQVVGTRHPPGEEAGEGAAAEPSHGLVAAQVDEGRSARVAVAARLADAE